jgi:hypothetical protein
MDITLEDKIRNFKVQLLKASASDDRDRLIDQLFYAEQQRFAEDRPTPLSVQKVEPTLPKTNLGKKAHKRSTMPF